MILDRDYKKLEGKMNIDTVGQLKKKKIDLQNNNYNG